MDDLTKSVWDDEESTSIGDGRNTTLQYDQVNEPHTSTFNPASSSSVTAPLISTFNSFSIDDPFANPFSDDKPQEEVEEEEEEEEEEKQEGFREQKQEQGQEKHNKNNELEGGEQDNDFFKAGKVNGASDNGLYSPRKHHLQSQILSELTEGSDSFDLEQSLTKPTASKNILKSDQLFSDKDSPIKLSSSDQSSISSPSSVGPINLKKFKAKRPRRFDSKTNVQHLKGELENVNSNLLGPLTFENKKKRDNEEEKDVGNQGAQKETTELTTEAIGNQMGTIHEELLGNKKNSNNSPSKQKTTPKNSTKNTETNSYAEAPLKNDNQLEITVGDPMKVGDITTAHIMYTIKTRNKNLDSPNFPQIKEVSVQRRYSDFRWLFHQLQANHPGRIIPPPPAKQSLIGRFNEKIIEHRRLSLEKMLNHINTKPLLCNDPDFASFLTNENEGHAFGDASLDESAIQDGHSSVSSSFTTPTSTTTTTTTTTATAAANAANAAASAAFASTGFMSSLFSLSTKYTEPDSYFTKKKQYFDDLEYNLKQLLKTLELIGTQRLDLLNIWEEIAITMEELAAVEITKSTSDLFNAFSQVQYHIKDNIERLNLSDQLTMGFTVEEYLRLIDAINYTFKTRIKIFELLSSLNAQVDKLSRKLSLLPEKSFELERMKERQSSLQKDFNEISNTIKLELDEFEMTRIDDFRNNVEIYIENAIESQKEAIEVYETFYSRYIAVDSK